MTTHARRASAALVLTAALLPLFSACGTGDADRDGGDDPGASASADPALAFARCLRENGVDVPDPKPGSDGGGQVVIGPGGAGADVDPETFEAAHRACAKHLEGMPGAGGPGALTEEDRERMLEAARCFREHGVDVPDPDFSGGGAVEIPLGDPGDPAFEKAREACGPLFAAPGS